MENLGELIRKDIVAKDIPITKIAKKLGMSRQSISQIHLRKSFDLAFLQKLKDVLGLDYLHYFNNEKLKKHPNNEVIQVDSENPTPYSGNGKVEVNLNIKITGNGSTFKDVYKFLKVLEDEAEKLKLDIV